MPTSAKAAPSTEILLTSRQVAGLIQVTLNTFLEMVADGRCPPPTVNRSRRFRRWLREDVERWIRQGCPVIDPRKRR